MKEKRVPARLPAHLCGKKRGRLPIVVVVVAAVISVVGVTGVGVVAAAGLCLSKFLAQFPLVLGVSGAMIFANFRAQNVPNFAFGPLGQRRRASPRHGRRLEFFDRPVGLLSKQFKQDRSQGLIRSKQAGLFLRSVAAVPGWQPVVVVVDIVGIGGRRFLQSPSKLVHGVAKGFFVPVNASVGCHAAAAATRSIGIIFLSENGFRRFHRFDKAMASDQVGGHEAFLELRAVRATILLVLDLQIGRARDGAQQLARAVVRVAHKGMQHGYFLGHGLERIVEWKGVIVGVAVAVIGICIVLMKSSSRSIGTCCGSSSGCRRWRGFGRGSSGWFLLMLL